MGEVTPFDDVVLRVIGQVTDRRRGAYEKVYPHDVVVYLPVERSIRQMRRDMVKLSEMGLLRRHGSRGGYSLSVSVTSLAA